MIWETLKPYYPDQTTFIPSIVGIISGWCEAVATWLESPDAEDDVEQILELLIGRMKLLLEVRKFPISSCEKYEAKRPKA